MRTERRDIRLPSRWGEAVHTRYLNGSKILVVLLPGQNYSCARPVLHVARRAAVMEAGLDLLELEYGYMNAHRSLEREEAPIAIRESVEAVMSVQGEYERIVLVGKSLGSVALGEVSAELERTRGPHELRHLYLTPIGLTLPHIERTGGTVVYGQNDPMFGPEQSSGLDGLPGVRAIAIEGANHTLETPDFDGTMDVLKRLAALYTDFFAEAGAE